MISIRIEQASDQLNIIMEDDGKGLNEAKMREKALANENLDQKQIQEIIDANECWRILFLPGI